MKREPVQSEAAEWIVTLHDPAATQADFAAWQTWMNRDPAHAEAFQHLQEAWRRSGAVARAPVEGEVEQALSAVDPEVLTSPRSRMQSRWAIAAVSLFAVLGVALTVWQARVRTIATKTAEMRTMQLADGSRVSLGPETRMKVNFSEDQRALQFEGGEAYFEVAHAPERPFLVTTSAGTVTALGTAFAVNADSDRLVVSVTEGTVRVDLPNGGAHQPVMVTAGRKLACNEGKVRTSQFAPAADAVSFQHGKLHYEDEPLRSVIADINRYSTSKLRIDDAAVSEMSYTGTVLTDSLDAWLSALPGVFPVRIEEQDGQRVLLASK